MATGRGVNQGKTKFVEERLHEDSTANVESINRAWKEAGNADSISDSLINKTRSRLNLTGKRGAGAPKAKAGAKGKARAAKGTPKAAAATNGRETAAAARTETSTSGLSDEVVDEVEAGIDDLMYTIKASGGHPEAEEALRAARRLLTRRSGGE